MIVEATLPIPYSNNISVWTLGIQGFDCATQPCSYSYLLNAYTPKYIQRLVARCWMNEHKWEHKHADVHENSRMNTNGNMNVNAKNEWEWPLSATVKMAKINLQLRQLEP